MSEIKTNKLTGTSTAGSISVTGEGNSTTTNLQQGLAKVFCAYQMSTSNAINGSFNVSSQTDTATGHSTLAYTNNMSAAGEYAAHGMSSDQNYMCANQGRTAAAGTALTTSDGDFSCVSDAGADKDSNINLISIHGDLA